MVDAEGFLHTGTYFMHVDNVSDFRLSFIANDTNIFVENVYFRWEHLMWVRYSAKREVSLGTTNIKRPFGTKKKTIQTLESDIFNCCVRERCGCLIKGIIGGHKIGPDV